MKSAAVSLVAFLLLAAPAAEAKDARYAGVHPRTGRPDGGMCFIEVVHVHLAAPVFPAMYRQYQGAWIFIGDPVPFGWEGPRVQYYGAHPVTVNVVFGPGNDVYYCYLEGPHFHAFKPPDQYPWERKGDVYYFTGDYPQEYEREKARYAPVNEVYRPIEYQRPVVVGPPPPAYHGPIVEIRIPAPPSVHIAVPVPVAPAIIVAPPPPAVIVVPPPGHQKKFKHGKFKKFKGRD